MKYITVVRNVGNTAIGYRKVYECLAYISHKPIAKIEKDQGMATITLYDERGVAHTRKGPDDLRVYAIADAWLKEQGYTIKEADLADHRADND